MSLIDRSRIPWDEFLVLRYREILAVVAVVVGLLVFLRMGVLSRENVLSGQVSSEGKPVVFGTITVMAADNRTYSVPIKPDGTYVLRGVPPGPIRLAVSSPNPVPIEERPVASQAAGEPGAAPAARPGAPGRRPAGEGAGGKQTAEDVSGEKMGIAVPSKTQVSRPAGSAAQTPASAGWFRIPGRYASPVTSGLKADAGKGRTTLDLKLDK